jgi:hypothetical protein
LEDQEAQLEEQKDRNPDRVHGTCEWFTSHQRFLNWKDTKGSALLWVTADPGCGKSVLVKYLIDRVLPSANDRTTCFFFFKDDYEEQREVLPALGCILYQLFRQQPHLLSDEIVENFDLDGDVDGKTFGNFHALWRILLEVTNRDIRGEVICIVDALDECEERGRIQLLKALSKFYSAETGKPPLKFLITSRPYSNIHQQLISLETEQPTIHLSGEDQVEADMISREVDLVIEAQLSRLGTAGLSYEDRQALRQKVTESPNRTYLWVYLVFDNLKDKLPDVSSQPEMLEHIHSLPTSVPAAYDKILSKSSNVNLAKKLLHIVVAANRALTLGEISVALAITPNTRSISDLGELKSSDLLRQNIRQACGLFLIIRDLRIYLLHQSAREFLVQNLSNSPLGMTRPSLAWQHSLSPEESHQILATICTQYLLLAGLKQAAESIDTYKADTESIATDKLDSRLSFLDYSARHWAGHFRQMNKKSRKFMTHSALRLCDTDMQTCSTWFEIYWTSHELTHDSKRRRPRFNALIFASYLGLEQAVKLLIRRKDINIASQDNIYGRTALSWASWEGHDSVVNLLISRVLRWHKFLITRRLSTSSNIMDIKDSNGCTPLLNAALNGHAIVFRILVDRGADINTTDNSGMTPLARAAWEGHEVITRILVDRGADINTTDDLGMTPLASAVWGGHEVITRILVDRGANINTTDNSGITPLA